MSEHLASMIHILDQKEELDGDENNININNLVPLFGVAEEHEYYIDRLARENQCRVAPAMNITVDEDTNLDNFLVTDTGRIFSIKSKQWMVPRMSYGYLQVKLRVPSLANPDILIQKGYMVHRLVCRAFHGPPPIDQRVVDHIDNDPRNNNSNNLRWASHSENMRYRRDQPARPREEPLPPQPLLNEHPVWQNVGLYLRGRDLSNYQVCSPGVVRDIRHPAYILPQRISGMGYRMVTLRDATTGVENAYPVHMLVAYTFHRDTYHPDTPVVDHINENKLDNRAENLRWVTAMINTAAATGVRIRRTDIQTTEVVEYPSIGDCLRNNPECSGLRHHISERMEPRAYGNLEFQRLDPLRPRPGRQG